MSIRENIRSANIKACCDRSVRVEISRRICYNIIKRTRRILNAKEDTQRKKLCGMPLMLYI